VNNSLIKYCLIIFSLIFFINTISFSQTETDEQLAAQYFQNKEFDKAVVLYEKLYSKKQEYIYYNPFLNCLVGLKDYKKAEKIIKKQIKVHPLIPQYGVDLGYLYLAQGNETLAKEQFESLIKNAQQEKRYVIDLANAFLYRNETDYAIQTYLKARKLMKGGYPFNLELADIYDNQKEYEKMMEEYVGLLEFSTSYQDEVQNLLQTMLAEETDNNKSTALKNILLKRVQQNPDETFYSEMLLWYSIQMKDFETALIQAKSLDRRNSEDGKRVFNIARLAASNGYYDVAISAYQYITNKGSENYYFLNSKIEILDVKYLKITSATTYIVNDLEDIEKDYQSALKELGKSPSSISLMKNLAHIQAFYLDKSSDAIKLLYEALEFRNAQPQALAECKIELADILLMTGEVWEATLLYSQVEKAFKDEPIGHLAKFKNAKLFYYIGEFEWAKAQLDVLKAATSKLIANDAMELSLLINDNSEIDSTYKALGMYARADLLIFRNKLDDGLLTLDSLLAKYPNHSLSDEVYYKKADVYIKKGLNDSAVTCYQKIIDYYWYDILGDDAMFKLAALYEDVYKDSKKALDMCEKLMTTYPGSTYSVEARKKYRALRGDSVN